MRAISEDAILPGMEGTLSTAPPPTEGEWVEVAPGQYLAEADADALPRYALAKIKPSEGGQFSIELDEESPLGYFRIKQSMKIADDIKMQGLSYKTLRRLCIAGFVDYLELAPCTLFVSIDSLKDHMARTKNSRWDGEGFWTPEKMERWRETCGM